MDNTEFYYRLSASKAASPQERRKAYRKMTNEYHSAVNKEPRAEETNKHGHEADKSKGNEQKPATYAHYEAAGANGGFGGGTGGFDGFNGGAGFGGFEDIFSSFFGGGGATRNPKAPRQGDDLQYRVDLTFEEAVFGVEKE